MLKGKVVFVVVDEDVDSVWENKDDAIERKNELNRPRFGSLGDIHYEVKKMVIQ